MSCLPVVTYKGRLQISVSEHAYQRASEMGVPREVLLECLRDPDEVQSPLPKYPDTPMWCRSDLTVPARACASCGSHLVAVTVLPRTQEAWHIANDRGLLGDGRELRGVAHLPTRAALIATDNFRPFSTERRRAS